ADEERGIICLGFGVDVDPLSLGRVTSDGLPHVVDRNAVALVIEIASELRQRQLPCPVNLGEFVISKWRKYEQHTHVGCCHTLIEQARCRLAPEVLIEYPDQLLRGRHRLAVPGHDCELAVFEEAASTSVTHGNRAPHL